MRLPLAACVSLGIVVFAACGNDYESSDPSPSTDGGTRFEGGASSSSGSSGKPNGDSGAPPFKEEEELPCEGRTATDAYSIYVAPSGTDGPTCGTRETPCKTVQAGITQASAAQKPKVLVGAGTYTETLLLDGGITIEGGWNVSGSTWTASCGADHASLATIRAPDSANTSVKATRGASVLRFLTIKSKAAAEPGESLYGLIVVGPNVKVAIDDTSLIVADGGKGKDGALVSGTRPADVCAVSGDGKQGATGKDGTAGSPGTLSSSTFTPGAGGDGEPGEVGHSGTAAPTPTEIMYQSCDVTGAPAACSSVSHTTTPAKGSSGCGGGGGLGGKGGGGGGSSVGILATDAIVVTYGGSVITGAGGMGGAGSPGAVGADGQLGLPGSNGTYPKAPGSGCSVDVTMCNNTVGDLPGGAAGGDGGKGGIGGQGGGGPGGWSISFAKFGSAALLASTKTVFTTTIGGKGGAPNGTDGLRQQQWP